MSESIAHTLGELSADVKTLVENQRQILSTLTAHDRELSESRGASRANRWLILTCPPIIVVAWDVIKSLFHSGAGGHS